MSEPTSDESQYQALSDALDMFIWETKVATALFLEAAAELDARDAAEAEDAGDA
jgi:hypothetical protein